MREARSADYKGFIRQASIIVFIILALYLALVRPLAKQSVNMLQSQIDETIDELEHFIPAEGKGLLPTKESVAFLDNRIAQNMRNYQDLKNFIDPVKEYLPSEAEEGGLYFIEQLHITRKRLRRQANTLKIEIPETFGLSEEMPENAENVELLLRELDLVATVTTLLLEEGVHEISLIKPLPSVQHRDMETQRVFYSRLPLQLSFLCDSATLIKLLYQMKNVSPVLVVKDIVIKKTEGPSLRVEILLSRIIVL
jgi:hypothetical protein